MMIEKYAAALRHQNRYGNLPLHIECSNNCRSSITSKCIELYPESLAVTDKNGDLPLHMLLRNKLSSLDDVLSMIEKYPAALNHQNKCHGYLPLHIECMYQCRSAIISKCIDIYPESLAVADQAADLLLHWLLSRKSSIDQALMMIKKCLAALKHVGCRDLPLHIECANQSRLSILSKCIELYPEALCLARRDICHCITYCGAKENLIMWR
jgi:hypothetical protein